MTGEDKILTLLSVLGAIASIVAAALAFWQAYQARQAATKAEQIRDEMISRRKLSELAAIEALTEQILRSVSNIGPSSNSSRLSGMDFQGIAYDIAGYVIELQKCRSHFFANFEDRATILCTELRREIALLSDARDGATAKAIGCRIYAKIADFLPVIKEQTDDAREDVGDQQG